MVIGSRWTFCRPGVFSICDLMPAIYIHLLLLCVLCGYLLIILLTNRLLLLFAYKVDETCIEIKSATVSFERRLHVFNLF